MCPLVFILIHCFVVIGQVTGMALGMYKVLLLYTSGNGVLVINY